MSITAIYPGSFDPVTNGHLDIIERGATLTDRLIVSVAINIGKSPMFTIEERVELLRQEVDTMKIEKGLTATIEVQTFSGLLIDYAQSVGAKMILRGLRAVTDFDYEFQMTGMNRRMRRDIETVFLMASERNQFIASRMVKEVALLGGDVSVFVPKRVAEALKERCEEKK